MAVGTTTVQHSGPRLADTAFQLAQHVLILGSFATTVLFVVSAPWAQSRSDQGLPLDDFLKLDQSVALAVVTASQTVLTAVMGTALKDAFDYLQWHLMARRGGLDYATVLAMSSTTGSLGTLALLFAPLAKVNASAKFWALLRVSFTVAVLLSGIVLFTNTSSITVYDTAYAYNVSAGVGPFNASLIDPFISFIQSLAPEYPYQVLPFTYFASVYVLVLNPLLSTIASPLQCNGPGCVSYLLSGGLSMVGPWIPHGYTDHSLVRIENVPSVQLEFSGPGDSTFDGADCDVFGETGFAIAIKLCAVPHPSSPGSLRAGLFVCTNGTADSNLCKTVHPTPNITTTATFYTRQATIITARSNYSIISVEDTTPPTPLPSLNIPAYRHALRWLLNYTAASIPPPSSIAQGFWSSADQLRDPSTHGIMAQNFQSILAFPFWLFNANNWANTNLRENEISPGLPGEFYTRAALVEGYAKLGFDSERFAVFVALQGCAVVFIWGVLVWVCVAEGRLPGTSSFPLFDFANRTRVSRGVVGGLGDGSERDIIEKTAGVRIESLLR